MVAVATDNGSPARSATAFVTIKVIKNFNAPVWTTLSYQANILEIQDLGVALSLFPSALTAGVQDSDNTAPNNQINFRLTGTTQGQQFFQISPTGEVSVMRSLTTGTSSSYQVKCLYNTQIYFFLWKQKFDVEFLWFYSDLFFALYVKQRF